MNDGLINLYLMTCKLMLCKSFVIDKMKYDYCIYWTVVSEFLPFQSYFRSFGDTACFMQVFQLAWLPWCFEVNASKWLRNAKTSELIFPSSCLGLNRKITVRRQDTLVGPIRIQDVKENQGLQWIEHLHNFSY